ncbi:imidazolonepropionase [Alicyclobacillus acidoterrestris]|uniref:Imidazolonepropionase n=1 Tax=Alicyclobacillus acidoterrestris (strain ATCC 49025 / DSM 3922 / CIP 106132 / NCIMB 13137 / GD3B) TaxID=1356854 RepID=A0A9E6ZHL5_ALIAG|nr:imidazolonepropionase [Alicyclobacillus acidoterrestris]UNO50937.1 imidazolonepropionase [Alicyclobacillus acidoterrestris]
MDDESHSDGPRCGADAMQTVGEMRDAAIAIDDAGVIVDVGPEKSIVDLADANTQFIDAEGGFVGPGLVDPHTHLVHGGSREKELPLRLAGASYLDILQAGGGILSTVRETSAYSEEALFAQAKTSLARMQRFGVTTVEAKTGYSSSLAVELKQLRVAQRLAEWAGIEIVHTAMPAHAVPKALPRGRDAYIEELLAMLPDLQAAGAEFADVFVEDGVFSVDEGRQILQAAKRLGMKVKIHADEMVPIGGAQLAAELGATSADHLLASTDEGLFALAEAGVMAVCLPGTSFYLQKPAARARFMLDEAQLGVAIASDYNPGTCPSENFGLTMSLALLTLKMTPEEVFVAATRNAACALGRGDVAGIIRSGRPADIVIYAAANPEYVLTHFGVSHVRQVLVKGRPVL